jgi:XTP/dITP diphosphohydrolase
MEACQLVVSSRNRDKLGELSALLRQLPLDVISAADAGVPDVEETGETFLDNALLKAAEAWRVSGGPTLADDSGLEVLALDGAPGVYSARFAGEDVTYEDNNRKLIEVLSGVPRESRGASFVCTLALLVPEAWAVEPGDGATWRRESHPDCPPGAALYVVEGRVHGEITEAAAGDAGFGYDPLFYFPPSGCTFAEISREEKNSVSHRGQALRGLRDCLSAMGAAGTQSG